MRAVFVGEAMIEISLDQTRSSQVKTAVAGDVLNTAVYFKRLMGQRVDVDFVSALGCDPLSDEIDRFIGSEEIGTGKIRRVTHRNCGLYCISTDPSGERRFSYWRENSAARLLFEDGQDLDNLAVADLVFFSGITLAILSETSRQLYLDRLQRFQSNSGKTIVFDGNYRPRLWEDVETARYWTEQAARIATILLPSVDDEMALFGDNDAMAVLDRVRSYGRKHGALKQGQKGSVSLADQAVSAPPVPEVRAVDTTAAGDSFNAGYLAAHLSGANETDCLRQGQRLAAEIIRHPGAIVPPDNWEKIRRLLSD